MERATDEDLLGYTLGALEAEELERIDALIRGNPVLHRRVEQLRHQLERLDELNPPGKPRAGLARRTCERVAAVPLQGPSPTSLPERGLAADAPLAPQRLAPRRHRSSDRLVFSRKRTILEIGAAAAVLLLLGSLALMVIQSNRNQARILACQEHLRTTGLALLDFARSHGGLHLEIPRETKLSFAGAYGPILVEAGFLSDPSVLLCAGTGNSDPPVIPTIEELERAEGPDLIRLQRRAGGDYAYNLGHFVDGRYLTSRNTGRSDYPLLGDNPDPSQAGRRSSNHGSKGQNVFFEDGRIALLPLPLVNGDSIYENDWGNVAPGVTMQDCVLGSSATPVLTTQLISAE